MVRSGGRGLSFDVLATTTFEDNDITTIHRSKSDPPALQTDVASSISPRRNRRKRRNKNSRKKALSDCLEEINGDKFDSGSSSVRKSVVYEEMSVPEEKSVVSVEFCNLHGGELRQRSVNVREDEEEEENKNDLYENFRCDSSKQVDGVIDGMRSRKLEREESFDWKRVMAKDPNCELCKSFTNVICERFTFLLFLVVSRA